MERSHASYQKTPAPACPSGEAYLSRRVRVYAYGEGNETVYGSGPWETVFGIGGRVGGERGGGDGGASAGLGGCVCKPVPNVSGKVVGGQSSRRRTSSMDVQFPLPCDLSARFDSGMMIPITPANVEAW